MSVIFIQSFKINSKFFAPIIVSISFFILFLALRSFIRLGDWIDPLTLYSHDSKITQSYLLENSYGYELMQRNEMNNAYIHLKKSVELFETPFNTNSLGVYYYKKGDIKHALFLFQKSISLGDYFLSYQNYARLLVANKDSKESILFLQKAITKFPKNDVFYFLLSIAQYRNGNQDEALRAAQKAYGLLPSQQNAYVLQQLLNNETIQIK